MFNKIFSKNSSKEEKSEEKDSLLIQRLPSMNLTDMRLYVKNSIHEMESTENGLVEILKRLTLEDETSSKRYIESDNMDSKIKKAFDLVIVIAEHKKITLDAVELIQEFINVYQGIILNFDRQNKQIYESKLRTALEKSIEGVNQRTALQRKMDVLGS
ncbi:MAG: hypothetical protein GW906_07920 [Epsilonproteobacteria bacterium]|nr:hypothetical protein [Campylobacterota bacterium]OIO17985.1 MAG: hypothetical protein AUJ81_00475 [Helicobacteraceae bacterium CG1_02_36_14]PIP09994.1 MAG: hypothetical protein COX50_08125 [Sulfurimonas sp. CG23_combo_of_CG06-09_8_20_14_all_36_33]PIS25233.1 MAG: hypothetical protein COT46_06730 [Sulfurimonas sp. CG08_land_8_20_14_0_20_36_33]PIU35367.1 MAG: hypothetical protein COT05_03785 [Sulfurimonas sp. CG07_land_8_20_14_0_80_36_56]PIV05184.1 MAG: hypothetical protein COS56_02470 [Sulfur